MNCLKIVKEVQNGKRFLEADQYFDLIEKCNAINKEMIQYMLTLAINSGSIHDTFFYDQESYIEKLIEYQARYVDVDDFKEYLNDNGTEFSKDIPERTFDKLAEDLVILDFETLKSQAIETIEEILDESDEDEEDDDEEKEYEDTEESIEEELNDLDEEIGDFDDLLDSDDDGDEEEDE